MTDEVKVTQSDRDAAADYVAHHNFLWAKDIRAAKSDEHQAIQAFARHRQTALSDIEAKLVAQEKISDDVHQSLWKAEEENARLREALERISYGRSSVTECYLIARDALTGAKEHRP